MLRLPRRTLFVIALAFGACQKSAARQQEEAITAQLKADEAARKASAERAKTVSQAELKAVDDIARARGEIEKVNEKAIATELDETGAAQRRADKAARAAAEATERDQRALRQSAESRLDKFDRRVRDANTKLESTQVPGDRAQSARQKLADVEAQISQLRSDLPDLQATPAAALDEAKKATDQRIAQIAHILDGVEDLL